MLDYKFKSKLITTHSLLEDLKITISNLNFWKHQWRDRKYKEFLTQGGAGTYKDFKKNNDPCWEMGLRIIGKRALWDPIVFLEWIFENKLNNKPKDLMERAENKKLVAFIKRNSSAESV